MGVIALIVVGINCSRLGSLELSFVDHILDLDDPIVDFSNKGDPENILHRSLEEGRILTHAVDS